MKDRSSPHPINNSEDYQFIYLVEGFLMSALYHSFCHWWYQQKSWRKEGLGTRLVNAYIKDMVLAFEAALSQAPPSFPLVAVRGKSLGTRLLRTADRGRWDTGRFVGSPAG